jgi:hypothetical protein
MAQNRFIHLKANQGVGWARQFVADSHGSTVPKIEHAPKTTSYRKPKLPRRGSVRGMTKRFLRFL